MPPHSLVYETNEGSHGTRAMSQNSRSRKQTATERKVEKPTGTGGECRCGSNHPRLYEHRTHIRMRVNAPGYGGWRSITRRAAEGGDLRPCPAACDISSPSVRAA